MWNLTHLLLLLTFIVITLTSVFTIILLTLTSSTSILTTLFIRYYPNFKSFLLEGNFLSPSRFKDPKTLFILSTVQLLGKKTFVARTLFNFSLACNLQISSFNLFSSRSLSFVSQILTTFFKTSGPR